MKKFIISALCCVAAFCAGYMVAFPKDYQTIKEANSWKRNYIQQCDSALYYMDVIVDQNGLLDADGSDEMAEYLHYRDVLDSLDATQL